MARKTKEDAQRTRMLILASALDLFVSKGYEHTTFTDIAARLNMTKGAVYWHFDSKEVLLKALIDMALAKFERQIVQLMPTGELTFPAVTEMMVENALSVVRDPRGSAFFRLMKCQIRWTDSTMDVVRESLLNERNVGPKEAFKTALENDRRAKRIRSDVNDEEVATLCLAIWDGMVQAHIDHFLQCDLEKTLRDAFNAMWKAMQPA